MHRQSNHDPVRIDVWAEHLVVLDLVGIRAGRTREQIHTSLASVGSSRVEEAILRLVDAGVLEVRAARIRQTPALERLDRLDMICI